MSPRTIAEFALAGLSVVVCAGLALGAYLAADGALDRAIPPDRPALTLVRGLVAMWAVVLFAWLLEQAERLAAPREGTSVRGSGWGTSRGQACRGEHLPSPVVVSTGESARP